MLKKLLLNKIAFRLVQSLKYRLNSYINKYHQEVAKQLNKSWNTHFKQHDYFIHETHGIQIELYKDSVLSPLIFREEFETKELKFLSDQLKNGDVFLDIGSNIGLFSLIAASCVGKEGKVIAYEPSIRIYHRLKRNIELNSFTQITALNKGLSDKKGNLTFYEKGDGFDAWSTFAPSNNPAEITEEVNVEVSTLDEEILAFKQISIEPQNIKFIKIDVEGWEKFVLLGGKNFLENFAPILLVEFTDTNAIQSGYFMGEVYNLVEQYGYTWYRINDSGQLELETRRIRYPYDNLVAMKANTVN